MSAAPQPLPEGEKLLGKLPPGLGEWLFKDKDQVLGPVPPELLLTKLYEGELTADTPVAKEIGQWKPLREIWFLGAHVPRAQARASYVRARQERVDTESRHARTRLLLASLVFAVLFVAALGFSRWLMITRPWADKTDWPSQRPAFVGLPDRTPRVAAVVPKPVETAPEKPAAAEDPARKETAPEDKDAEDKDDKKGKGKGKDAKAKDPKAKDAKGKDTKAADTKGKDEKGAAKKEAPKAEPDVKKEAPAVAGVAQELTNDQILSTFKASAGAYTSCIREEATRNPEMPGTITIEFVIRNDGSTGDFKVQEREIRDGPLAKCLGTKVAALRFPRFTGERKQFIFPFKITRRK